MALNEYISRFDIPKNSYWFVEECNKPHHMARISNTISNRDYLAGRHSVLWREDVAYKGQLFIVRKTILNYAKTILTFHSTYLMGKPITITSTDEETVKVMNDIYKQGHYDTIDYQIIDRVNKFGDAYEVIYYENGIVKSKILDSADCYPVYDELGNYIAFIEHWTDSYSNISFWNVYYDDIVEHWCDSGSDISMIGADSNICGLPIHYHNFNDEDYLFGSSTLKDIKPILDDLEDIMSKMGDAIYVNTLNPMPVVVGQRIDSTIPADATGYVLNLDHGSFNVVNTEMDYNTIKLYLDNMKFMLDDIACYPSALSGNTNIANISEVSLKMLFHMASCKALENEKWFDIGIQQRFDRIKSILSKVGINLVGDIDVEYNLSIPMATSEVVNNLKTMREMGAISLDTVMEKSDLIKDTSIEKERLNREPKDSVNVEKPSNIKGSNDIKGDGNKDLE